MCTCRVMFRWFDVSLKSPGSREELWRSQAQETAEPKNILHGSWQSSVTSGKFHENPLFNVCFHGNMIEEMDGFSLIFHFHLWLYWRVYFCTGICMEQSPQMICTEIFQWCTSKRIVQPCLMKPDSQSSGFRFLEFGMRLVVSTMALSQNGEFPWISQLFNTF